jgi:hypothetical protein
MPKGRLSWRLLKPCHQCSRGRVNEGMSRRLRRLRDWPECLKRLTDDELEAERRHWVHRSSELGHRQAIKGCLDRARDCEKEMARREREAEPE